MNIVDVDGLVVSCCGRALFPPTSFALSEGATLGLSGPSGAGKSTVLRTLVGLLPAGLSAEGKVRVLGVDVVSRDLAGTSGRKAPDLPALRARAALVGQTPVVFPASILANAVFGLRHVVRLTRPELRARAEAALVEAGLWDEVSDRLDNSAEELSVGQRQRLCLARALALDPALLLLDEPTSALDAAATKVVEAAVAGLSGKRSVLIVSHDQGQLDRLCDEVEILEPAGNLAG